MKWGPDMEARADVVKKAHDAYATASAAREAVTGVQSDINEHANRMDRLDAVDGQQIRRVIATEEEVEKLRRIVTTLALRIDELERAARPTKARKAS